MVCLIRKASDGTDRYDHGQVYGTQGSQTADAARLDPVGGTEVIIPQQAEYLHAVLVVQVAGRLVCQHDRRAKRMRSRQR